MFDHVTLRATDLAASERFYALVLAALGIEPTSDQEWEDFSLAQAGEAKPATRGLHIGFVAPSRAHVDAFWRAGRDAGHPDAGAPGERPQYRADYYGAFLLDPDGNSAEAVHHAGVGGGDHVDHLWLRVADVAAAKRFYATVAPYTGFHLTTDTGERVAFRGPAGSFSLVAGGTRTRHVHNAFPAPDDPTVEAFHRAATDAGYRDNGPPGERPEYHPGYYGAFVCDPDGHNVEAVCHHRG